MLIRILLIFVAVVAVVWWLRGVRRVPLAASTSESAAANASAAPAPQTMGVCAHCGVHLPSSDLVRGAAGVYCGEAHRAAAGDRQP